MTGISTLVFIFMIPISCQILLKSKKIENKMKIVHNKYCKGTTMRLNVLFVDLYIFIYLFIYTYIYLVGDVDPGTRCRLKEIKSERRDAA